ncbi:sigma-70 family RNA polymerase sigma factor [Pseudobacteroides cellulosolvens]|uniref:RNA polymerase, sigma 28 subunit, FliA/WhiG subfamily n=1 Tax=Pseudobacteroides cellulosolvens ATCC 35603 = DSM 2933 TaxID=398512 RepID=A0A0L6JIH8_9FIRM|nr:sigma-70 family RNA polymerase sigma factor [Pseudobacteroides cellulosolvens]KNY25544.1 RNA polymerase, sigma 28 subunit, FliA/WhiG subfamily [Pseudobacteroides cellulosolvens ATCC 35603 = DSM 2933]
MSIIKKLEENYYSKAIEEKARDYFENKTDVNLEEVINSIKPIIKHFAFKYRRNELVSDLIQEGYIGFLKALKAYSYVEGAKFTTFACHYIHGEIRHFLRKENSYYKPGDSLNLDSKIKSFIENKRTPTVTEISKEFNITYNYVVRILNTGLISLDDLETTSHHIPYNDENGIIENRLLLKQLINNLEPTFKQVLIMTYYKDFSQVKVGKELGMNQRKVSRILHKCLVTLRNEMCIS